MKFADLIKKPCPSPPPQKETQELAKQLIGRLLALPPPALLANEQVKFKQWSLLLDYLNAYDADAEWLRGK